MRVTLFTNVPAPYRIPQWNALSDMCELSVVCLDAGVGERQWQVAESDIKPAIRRVGSKAISIPALDMYLHTAYRKPIKIVAETHPEAIIITGYDAVGYWAVLRWARKNRIPVVMWAESNELSSRTVGMKLFDAIRRQFISRCDGFYVPSAFTRDFLVRNGASADSVVIGRNSCDLSRFQHFDRIGNPSERTLLFVGQFIPRKGLRELTRALEQVADLPWKFLIAGSGPLEAELRRWADSPRIAGRVKFLGFVQQDSLGQLYQSADIFLFSSWRDVYPLVLVEALTSGLYVVGTSRSAASHDLIRPGLNGEIADPCNIDEYAAAIRRALARPSFDREAIHNTVADITPEGEARKLMKAVEIAAARSASEKAKLQLAQLHRA